MYQINDYISVLEPCNEPLSSDVAIIKGTEYTWIFDTGACDETAAVLSKIEGPVNAVISHFHSDHTTNIERLNLCNLYVSSHTYKYTKKGIVINSDTSINDGVSIRIIPIPTVHVKGALGMLVDDKFFFSGDALYPTAKVNRPVYNVQFIKEQMDLIATLPDECKVYMSHKMDKPRSKALTLRWLKQIYDKRESGNPYIDAVE